MMRITIPTNYQYEVDALAPLAKKDYCLVENGPSYILGRVVFIEGSMVEVDFGWSSTQTVPFKKCYKVMSTNNPAMPKIIPVLNDWDGKYFIWSGEYVGNSMVWWRAEAKGYTCDINKAGRYTEEEARNICSDNGKGNKAFSTIYILSNTIGTFDAQNLNPLAALKI